MRQKADKLEKGKWYADTATSFHTSPTFFRFLHETDDRGFFDLKKGGGYLMSIDGTYQFAWPIIFYLPTPEDIEKYNLNEE